MGGHVIVILAPQLAGTIKATTAIAHGTNSATITNSKKAVGVIDAIRNCAGRQIVCVAQLCAGVGCARRVAPFCASIH